MNKIGDCGEEVGTRLLWEAAGFLGTYFSGQPSIIIQEGLHGFGAGVMDRAEKGLFLGSLVL